MISYACFQFFFSCSVFNSDYLFPRCWIKTSKKTENREKRSELCRNSFILKINHRYFRLNKLVTLWTMWTKSIVKRHNKNSNKFQVFVSIEQIAKNNRIFFLVYLSLKHRQFIVHSLYISFWSDIFLIKFHLNFFSHLFSKSFDTESIRSPATVSMWWM